MKKQTLRSDLILAFSPLTTVASFGMAIALVPDVRRRSQRRSAMKRCNIQTANRSNRCMVVIPCGCSCQRGSLRLRRPPQEQNGFRYTAVMEWHKTAELFLTEHASGRLLPAPVGAHHAPAAATGEIGLWSLAGGFSKPPASAGACDSLG